MMILLVEENCLFGTSIKKELENQNHEVCWVKTKADAITELEKSSSLFSAALLDVNLSDAPNGEAIDEVVKYQIPTIIVTGDLDSDTRKFVWEKKVADYVLKNDPQLLNYIISFLEKLQRNKTTKVIVVDDSNMFRHTISNLLKIHCFNVFMAKNGREALEIVEKNQDIKLVITDYNMPGIDGFELMQRLRSKYSKETLAIIGISSEDAPVLAANFIKSGANDFIIKQSFISEEFYSRVNHCLDNLFMIEELRKVNEKKNTFLGMAAHDLRNPISGIRGFSEMMLEGDLDEESIQEFLELIHTASGDMLILLNDLLDVSHIESGKFVLNKEKTEISELIKRRLFLLKTSADKKNIELKENLNTQKPFFFDPGKVGQAIDNFITNAIKYSPPETSATISLTGGETQIEFRVKDEGPGISENEQSKLFQEFSKLSTLSTAGEKSTGLGLSITKKIIEAHGGTVGIESTIGKGCTFFFTLPISQTD